MYQDVSVLHVRGYFSTFKSIITILLQIIKYVFTKTIKENISVTSTYSLKCSIGGSWLCEMAKRHEIGKIVKCTVYMPNALLMIDCRAAEYGYKPLKFIMKQLC